MTIQTTQAAKTIAHAINNLQLKTQSPRNKQHINKPRSNERGFYYGRLLKGDKNELATRIQYGDYLFSLQ